MNDLQSMIVNEIPIFGVGKQKLFMTDTQATTGVLLFSKFSSQRFVLMCFRTNFAHDIYKTYERFNFFSNQDEAGMEICHSL